MESHENRTPFLSKKWCTIFIFCERFCQFVAFVSTNFAKESHHDNRKSFQRMIITKNIQPMMKPMTKQSLTAIVLLVMLAFASSTTVSAQRLQQKMGRGVVAVKNGSNATITWRRFAQEPEDAKYNVYVNGTKLNSSPLSNTNYATQSSLLPAGAKVAVTLVKNGVEQEQSGAYVVKNYDLRNIVVDIHFERGGSPLQSSNFDTSYVWPVDLMAMAKWTMW